MQGIQTTPILYSMFFSHDSFISSGKKSFNYIFCKLDVIWKTPEIRMLFGKPAHSTNKGCRRLHIFEISGFSYFQCTFLVQVHLFRNRGRARCAARALVSLYAGIMLPSFQCGYPKHSHRRLYMFFTRFVHQFWKKMFNCIPCKIKKKRPEFMYYLENQHIQQISGFPEQLFGIALRIKILINCEMRRNRPQLSSLHLRVNCIGNVLVKSFQVCMFVKRSPRKYLTFQNIVFLLVIAGSPKIIKKPT